MNLICSGYFFHCLYDMEFYRRSMGLILRFSCFSLIGVSNKIEVMGQILFRVRFYDLVYELRPVLLENSFFQKVNSGKMNSDKVNYFLIFDSVMKNKLENAFQLENTLLNYAFVFSYLCILQDLGTYIIAILIGELPTPPISIHI